MQNRDVHDRRARPTLRVLNDDLTTGWDDASARRALADGRLETLCPVAELRHPLIAKSREWFGSDPAGDSYHQPIACAANLGLFEVRAGQWRGAIWTDQDSGVRWLVAAGLAKGNHADTDDFYVQLARIFEAERQAMFLPTAEDQRLLKLETANALIHAWELSLQQNVADLLAEIASAGGRRRMTVEHPIHAQLLATVDIEMAVESGDGYAAEVFVVEVDVERPFRGRNLTWTMMTRILTCIYPPAQDWDRSGATMSAMAEMGHAARQAQNLGQLTARGELSRSVPGTVSHWAHRKNLAQSTVDGHAVRAMCGVYFVPFQDHEALPVCPECAEVRELMPE